MPYVYADIITAAEDQSVYFDRSRIPRGVAARLLSDIQRDLLVEYAKRDPDAASTTVTLTGSTVVAALGTPPTAVPLPPAMQYVRARVVVSGAVTQPYDLVLITPDHLSEWVGQGYYLQGGNCYFTGQAADWANIDSVIITYIPFVGDFATEADTFVLPDTAKGALVARLALAFALRVNNTPASTEQPDFSQMVTVDVNAFSSMASKAQNNWLAQVSDQRRKSRLSITNGADFR